MTMLRERDLSAKARALPVGALLFSIICFQYGAALAGSLFASIGPNGATALRLGVAALVLAAIRRPWRLRPSRRGAVALLGYGAALAAMNLLFYMALSRIPLGVTVALEFSGPLLVSVLASRRRLDFAWVALAAAGLLLLSPLVRGAHAIDPRGTAMALGAGACWALYIVLGQRAGRELGAQTTAIGMILAAICALPFGLAQAGLALIQPATLLGGLVLGVLCTALPFSLEMVALTRLPARTYGILTSLEPALGALMGRVLLQQHLSGLQWAGVALVVAASAGAATAMRVPARSVL